MRLLVCSDLHRDLVASRNLVRRSAEADVVVCAGDLAVMRQGLEEVVEVLSAIETPTVLVAGNGESDRELGEACRGWSSAQVLHGSGVDLGGRRIMKNGAAIPVTPFGAWSFDLSEDEGRALLADCPEGCVLVTHSPPHGHVDLAGGNHLGSKAVLEAVVRTSPELVVCGHIHGCWEQESRVEASRIVNAGPRGLLIDL
jgi:Icc-related predicted phosphoesterase